MPEDQRHREEPYRPADGTWHQATNVLPDKWGRHIVQSLGASHAWVLTITERLVVGYRCKARRVSISEIAESSGLGRERVYEVLADLEETGVIAIRDRARGRKPLIAVRLDWNPTQEALAAGAQLQKARSKRKHSGSANKDVSTPVDNLAEMKLSTPVDNQMPTPVDNFEERNMPTPVGNQVSTPVDNKIERDTKETFPEAHRSSPDSDPLAGEAPGASERKERKTTPPSSSSSLLAPVGNQDPGANRNSVETDDDEKTKNSSESPGRVEKETSPDGDRFSRTAARGSWQELSDSIKAIPEDRITGEARVLAEKLREKVPRLEAARAERLSLYCGEAGAVAHLGAVVANVEKKLKFDVDNVWSYLIKALWPLPDASGNGKAPQKSFGEAYGAAQPGRTLGGVGRRHQFEAVESTQSRPIDDYFEPLFPENDAEEAAEAFGEAYEDARPRRTLGGKHSRDGFTGVGGRRPHKTEDYIERL